MPRLETLEDRPEAAPRRRSSSRSVKTKKPVPEVDRLSQRTLLWRRVKRSMRPGLWLLGAGALFVVGAELVRSLPSALPPSHKLAAPAATAALPAAQVSGAVPKAATVPVLQPSFISNALAGLGFRLEKIEINGTSTTTPQAVMAAMGLKIGDPVFGFSLKAAQQQVENLGPVQSAVIERLLPGTLVVDITERDIYAIWQTVQNGQPVFQIIDKKGDVIPGQDAAAAKRRQPSLLLLSGAGAPQQAETLIPELKAVPMVFSHVAAAECVDRLRWNLILKNHTVVKLPAQNQQAALTELAALQTSIQLLDRPVESIDLRQPGRLVVHPYVVAPVSLSKHNRADTRQEGQ